MKVPFCDLGAQFESVKDEVLANIGRVLRDGDFILGKDVAEFEQAFARYSQCEHAVGVASGLDAIKLVLRSLDIGPDDEVITAANTFIATALAVSAVGAAPVLVDADRDSYNIDPARIPEAITGRTRAILPVHLYGQPADMDAILAIARDRGLRVVEDASQAHGARYRGRRAGSFGHAAAFSLYPSKNLGACGDAGVVTTDDRSLAERVRALRNYGSGVKYHHDLLGENSRLDTLQAAVLKAKLARLDRWNEARRNAAALYSEKLNGVGDLVLPKTAPHAEHVFHLYVVRTRRRDELIERLRASGIGCIIHYPVPIHLQKAYEGFGWKQGDFPVTEELSSRVLSLPMFPEITEEQIDAVVGAIKDFFAG